MFKSGLKIEYKHHGSGFRQLYGWLQNGIDMLILRCDHSEPLAVLPLDDLINLVLAAEGKKRL